MIVIVIIIIVVIVDVIMTIIMSIMMIMMIMMMIIIKISIGNNIRLGYLVLEFNVYRLHVYNFIRTIKKFWLFHFKDFDNMAR